MPQKIKGGNDMKTSCVLVCFFIFAGCSSIPTAMEEWPSPTIRVEAENSCTGKPRYIYSEDEVSTIMSVKFERVFAKEYIKLQWPEKKLKRVSLDEDASKMPLSAGLKKPSILDFSYTDKYGFDKIYFWVVECDPGEWHSDQFPPISKFQRWEYQIILIKNGKRGRIIDYIPPNYKLLLSRMEGY
jgi:hypothetical protein